MQPAHERFDTEDGEEIAADPQPFRPADFAAAGQIESLRCPGKHCGESLLPVADLLPLREGEIGIARVKIARPAMGLVNLHLHQFLRALHGQGAQPHRVDQLEERRIRPNAQRQRENGCRREPGVQPQQPRRMPQVLPQRFYEPQTVHVENLLPHQSHVSEFPLRRRTRLDRRHSPRDVFRRLKLQVGFDLAPALLLPGLPQEEAAQTAKRSGQHGFSPRRDAARVRWRAPVAPSALSAA